MKVYVVIACIDESVGRAVGVFTTKEKAEQWEKENTHEEYGSWFGNCIIANDPNLIYSAFIEDNRKFEIEKDLKSGDTVYVLSSSSMDSRSVDEVSAYPIKEYTGEYSGTFCEEYILDEFKEEE